MVRRLAVDLIGRGIREAEGAGERPSAGEKDERAGKTDSE